MSLRAICGNISCISRRAHSNPSSCRPSHSTVSSSRFLNLSAKQSSTSLTFMKRGLCRKTNVSRRSPDALRVESMWSRVARWNVSRSPPCRPTDFKFVSLDMSNSYVSTAKANQSQQITNRIDLQSETLYPTQSHRCSKTGDAPRKVKSSATV